MENAMGHKSKYGVDRLFPEFSADCVLPEYQAYEGEFGKGYWERAEVCLSIWFKTIKEKSDPSGEALNKATKSLLRKDPFFIEACKHEIGYYLMAKESLPKLVKSSRKRESMKKNAWTTLKIEKLLLSLGATEFTVEKIIDDLKYAKKISKSVRAAGNDKKFLFCISFGNIIRVPKKNGMSAPALIDAWFIYRIKRLMECCFGISKNVIELMMPLLKEIGVESISEGRIDGLLRSERFDSKYAERKFAAQYREISNNSFPIERIRNGHFQRTDDSKDARLPIDCSLGQKNLRVALGKKSKKR